MDDLIKHFPTQINLLKEIDEKYTNTDDELQELNEMVLQLKNINISLQESESKLRKKLNDRNDEIYQDMKIINDYHKLRNENDVLKTENECLKNQINNLEQKIKQIDIENKRNIDNTLNNFKMREKTLEEQIESLQASYSLDNYEKENEIKKMKYNYEQQLENALKREQGLKIELFDLKHQMTSSTSVLNKKIMELQEKNKPISSFTQKNTNFMSAKTILNITTTKRSDAQEITNKTSTNQLNNSTQIQNTVNINNIEINPAKKFHFRKPHNSGKKLLSEDFDPFKMHKENTTSFNNSQNDSSIVDCNIMDNSLVESEENIMKHKQQFNHLSEDIKNCIMQSELPLKNEKRFNLPKKRKLFDPNNLDYLE